jgi:hypothetical protein
MILKSPASKRRAYKNNKKNGIEQQTSSENNDCEYLELQYSPVGDHSNIDYVNIPVLESPKTSTAENMTSVKSEEGSSETKLSAVNTLYTPKSPASSDDSDLPDYVNVTVSTPEEHRPPPVPPRNK